MVALSECRNRGFGYLTLSSALNLKKKKTSQIPIIRLLNAGSASLKRGSLLHVKGTKKDVTAISLLTESPKIPVTDHRKFKQPDQLFVIIRCKFVFIVHHSCALQNGACGECRDDQVAREYEMGMTGTKCRYWWITKGAADSPCRR